MRLNRSPTPAEMEEYSYALLSLIVTQAGYCWSRRSPDRHKVDGEIFGGSENVTLHVQMKSTQSHRVNLKTGEFKYVLEDIEAYNILRDRNRRSCEHVLMIAIIPDQMDRWGDDPGNWPGELTARHGVYWYSLTGLPKTDNRTAVTLSIPERQRLTTSSLPKIMAKIAETGSVP